MDTDFNAETQRCKGAGIQGEISLGWTTGSVCNVTDFADNKLMVDRDKIQFDLIQLLNGGRILRLNSAYEQEKQG